MIQTILELLNSTNTKGNELIDIAKGKYELPTTKKIKIKWQSKKR